MLGKLEKVELRQVFKREDQDFTPWLAEEKNLELLGETIGIDLELEAQEKDVGPFRADLLCKTTEDDDWVLIENQIEKTDHKHLGQLMTYAAGLQAVTIVWVASKFTEEHRAALDWLNKITDDNFRFFGLEVELWKIEDSPAAPKFNIISKPNNWSKTISQAAKNISGGGRVGAMYQLYWQGLVDYLESKNSKLRPPPPSSENYQWFPVGRTGFGIEATLHRIENKISVDLYIAVKGKSKAYYNLLEQDKEAIEKEIGADLEWDAKPGKVVSKIIISKNFDVDMENTDDWSNQHEWLKTYIEKFDTVFRPRVKNLSVDNSND